MILHEEKAGRVAQAYQRLPEQQREFYESSAYSLEAAMLRHRLSMWR